MYVIPGTGTALERATSGWTSRATLSTTTAAAGYSLVRFTISQGPDVALIRAQRSTSIILRTALETPRRCGRFSTDSHLLFSCLNSTDVTSRPWCMSVRHELKCWGTTLFICSQKMLRTVDQSSTGLVVTCLFRGIHVFVPFSQQNWWWCSTTVTVLWQYSWCAYFQWSKSDTTINSRHVGRYCRVQEIH